MWTITLFKISLSDLAIPDGVPKTLKVAGNNASQAIRLARNFWKQQHKFIPEKSLLIKKDGEIDAEPSVVEVSPC